MLPARMYFQGWLLSFWHCGCRDAMVLIVHLLVFPAPLVLFLTEGRLLSHGLAQSRRQSRSQEFEYQRVAKAIG
jgi:hypothetical protein